jgi:hypothetical protein
MRRLIIAITSASVLACPYQCAVSVAAARALGSDQQPACCDDCRADKPRGPMRDQAPPPRAPLDDGRWCLCEGVVFDAGPRSPVDAIWLVSLWQWMPGRAEFLAVAPFPPHFAGAGLAPPLQGRLTRIALCSLLL